MVLKVDVPLDLVQGDVDEGYGPVADEFRRNFVDRNEIGAACAVYRDGKKVVDLWGGYRDGKQRIPWEQDTMLPVFSTTKGMAAMAVAIAHTRGLLDYDERVVTYWPEFAANGKEQVTVRQLLSHQAGLPAIDEPLDMEELADLDRLAAVLANQAPAWTPGAHQGYHAITLGWYEGALLQRVDPKGRTLGQFFAEEVAAPLGLEFHIGVPEEAARARIATIHGYKPPEMMLHLHEMPPKFVLKFMNPKSLSARTFQNPKVLGKIDNYNREDVQLVEIPAANGVGLVRSVAAAYGSFATGGAACGLKPDTLAALEEPARPPSEGLFDLVLQLDTIYSLGYFKPFPKLRFGGSEWRSYGTFGAGGSFGFADPEYGVGFCYAPNRSQFRFWDDAREVALRQAVYDVLGGPPQQPD